MSVNVLCTMTTVATAPCAFDASEGACGTSAARVLGTYIVMCGAVMCAKVGVLCHVLPGELSYYIDNEIRSFPP